ncbi:MAG: ATP synthase subunit I [Gammaproteobacteria bacterium]|nr:ATP synthase subunit I [Gammaproteobacteria bacterium]
MKSATAGTVQARARKVLGLQLAIGAVVAAGFYLLQTPAHAVAAAYGSAISLLSALWLSRGVAWASEQARGTGEAILYVSAALRFLMVLALFALGLMALRLQAVAMVAGFVLVQMAFVLAAGGRDQVEPENKN